MKIRSVVTGDVCVCGETGSDERASPGNSGREHVQEGRKAPSLSQGALV